MCVCVSEDRSFLGGLRESSFLIACEMDGLASVEGDTQSC